MSTPPSPHPSRRRFLKFASVGLSLGALRAAGPSSSLLAQTSSAAANGKTLGVALVGLGSYAMGELAPALQQTRYCRLSALVTGTPAKRQRFGDRYNIPQSHIYNYENYDQIAENPDIDIVYVVLPNSMHADFSIRAAEAGKHVICEKPMAVTVAECEAMIAACKQNNVTLNIGYRLHYDPYHQRIIEAGKDQRHHPVKYIQSEFSFFAGDPNQWRLKRDLAGGGAMMDLGVYCIQAARYAVGEEPSSVTAQEFKTDPVKFAEVDETILWQTNFPSGAVASCATSYNSSAQRLYISYHGNQAQVELSPSFIYRGLKGHFNHEPLDFGNPNQQALHMDAIAQAIQGGEPTTTPGEEGLKDMLVIEAIYRSIANGGRAERIG